MGQLKKVNAISEKFGRDYLLVNSCCEHIFLAEKEYNNYIEDITKCSPETIEILKSRFFVYEDSEEELFNKIYKIKYTTKHSYLENDNLLLMVVPTISCNCSCVYCQVNSKKDNSSENNMSFKTILNFCDFVFSLPHKHIKIEFQGGEPSLKFDSIETIVRRLTRLNKKQKKELDYVMCTNLLNISKHELKIIKKFNIAISSSLDGPKKLHNANRPSIHYSSTYDSYIENVKYVREHGIYPSGLVTITAQNLPHMRAIVDTYIENNFDGIFLRPLNNYGCAFKNKNVYYDLSKYIEAYKDAVTYLIKKNLNEGIHLREEMFSIILRKILTPFNDGFVDMQNPCALGQMCLMVKQNGDVYPSDESRMISEMGNEYWKMGNINSLDCLRTMKQKRIEILDTGRLENYEGCKNCIYSPFCYADPIKKWYIKNIAGENYESYCGIRKELFKFVFEQLRNADEKKLHLFREWANV
ncbi:His-Xaa-Ser system radical SAM maturase HxsB [Treponema pectinovorum]|uniref:His-Xaa-Ser system radical SAM maturase HxsB n=1 Tax=Treponema pectinovorum TaxID=164 RepID=UPI003D90B852